MSIHFHPLTVKEITKETADCVSVSFEIPDQLKNKFQYKHGQSLTMRTTIGGHEVRRTYSLCSSPIENKWKVAIKKAEGGLFSTFANEQLKCGDVLEVMEPVGKFNTSLDPLNKKNYLAFAAGSGITPVLSIIKTTLAAEPQSGFTLVYGNRSRSSIIFFEELEGLKNKYLNRFSLINILSRERTDAAINFGRIDSDKLTALNKFIDYINMDELFICGPGEMIFCVKDFLERIGVDKRKIHFELFTSSTPKKAIAVNKKADSKTGSYSSITIKVDGRSFEFPVSVNSDVTMPVKVVCAVPAKLSCLKAKWRWMFIGDWNRKKLKKDIYSPVNHIQKQKK